MLGLVWKVYQPLLEGELRHNQVNTVSPRQYFAIFSQILANFRLSHVIVIWGLSKGLVWFGKPTNHY